MTKREIISQKITALFVYGRPPLVFAGLICAIAVIWTQSPILYTIGVVFLFISMSFDLVDGWFAARFELHPRLEQLADRLMDKLVYSIIFPLVAVGVMWRVHFSSPDPTKGEMLHAILVLLLAVTVHEDVVGRKQCREQGHVVRFRQFVDGRCQFFAILEAMSPTIE